jgi:NitT/TauT family transport system substrate-binding protein
MYCLAKRTFAVSLGVIIVSGAISLLGIAAEPDRISIQLKWLHDAQFAGFYVAEQHGLYEAEGIEVELLPGGLAVDEIQAVASGEQTFGVIDSAQLLRAREQGFPLVAIAVIYRIWPSVFFSLAESGITQPTDFIGKRVIVNPANVSLPAMLARVGVSMDQIIPIAPTHDMTSFFSGDVDVWSGYLTNQVLSAREAGYDLNIIYPDDYGVHVYGDTIFATEALVESNPDLVTRFLRATLNGWRWAIENPVQAGPLALDYDSALDGQHQIHMMIASVPLIHTGEGPIGWMNPSVWQGIYNVLIEFASLEGTTEIEVAYAMEFLENIYGSTP